MRAELCGLKGIDVLPANWALIQMLLVVTKLLWMLYPPFDSAFIRTELFLSRSILFKRFLTLKASRDIIRWCLSPLEIHLDRAHTQAHLLGKLRIGKSLVSKHSDLLLLTVGHFSTSIHFPLEVERRF